MGTSFWPPVIAFALLPIFTNPYSAVREVAAAMVEAASRRGLRGGQVLRQHELPVASPEMFAGIRLAFIQVSALT